jgi:hAT family C-terminal dimerisation region
VHARASVWKKKGATIWPELTKVVLKLLAMHPTSASTERNWSLWGRVYTAARNALSLDRARKITTFCFNSRAQGASMDDIDLILETIAEVKE